MNRPISGIKTTGFVDRKGQKTSRHRCFGGCSRYLGGKGHRSGGPNHEQAAGCFSSPGSPLPVALSIVRWLLLRTASVSNEARPTPGLHGCRRIRIRLPSASILVSDHPFKLRCCWRLKCARQRGGQMSTPSPSWESVSSVSSESTPDTNMTGLSHQKGLWRINLVVVDMLFFISLRISWWSMRH